jgi:TonB family protein
VHLLLKFDARGTILHASIAASSGHLELDQAAVQAALLSGRLNNGGKTEIILPVTFRLQ